MAEYIINLLGNFLFIFGFIALFFAPFVGVFWWRHRAQIREKRPHFNQFAERFFVSRESNYLIMAWAATEAFIWFVIPEFLLFLVVFMKVRRKFDLLKYDIIGTVIGSIIGFMWHAPDSVLVKMPYIYQGMIDQVRVWYDSMGIWGLIHQPFSGVPFKLFTHTASEYGFSLLLFVLIAVVIRMSRYAVAYVITVGLYPLLHRFVRKHYAILFVVAIFIFTLLLMRVSDMYGAGYVVR